MLPCFPHGHSLHLHITFEVEVLPRSPDCLHADQFVELVNLIRYVRLVLAVEQHYLVKDGLPELVKIQPDQFDYDRHKVLQSLQT